MIPYGRQDISEADIDAVISVLRSDFLTQGPQVPKFERRVADYCGAGHAIAVNSATSALHIACLALGLGPGDWLWTSPITFVASSNCALYCGARVDFIDIDPRTYNMCPIALERKLMDAEKAGRLPKVVVPVHFAGQPCNMEEIHRLSLKYGFRLIEDAAHAIGGKYKGASIGGCQFSDISVFSFHPVKIITTGEGGMAMTNNPALASTMRLLSSHGVTREAARMTRPPEGPWSYQQVALGFNYRMTDIQAALGVSQMDRLDAFVSRRHALARRYDELLASLPVVTPFHHPDGYSGLHLYVVRLRLDQINRGRAEVFERLRAKGVGVNVHYIPVHTQPYYQRMGFAAGRFPEAEKFYREAITLPMYPRLNEAEQDSVVAALAECLL